ncbi:hypothetical protein EV360DRAFT_85768 [Lentinula raphanica]|nr:hypothetical protein EV360DRAFT_85768 [Lentinula raphanica]
MENISNDKQSENSLQVPESQSTEAHRKERPRHKYVTRTAVPKEYQVDYRRMKASDKSYKKPLELFYGFGVHRTDIMKYCETYIPSGLPEPFYLDSATEAAFLRDLRKHCDCRYMALMLAKRDDWNEGLNYFQYMIRIYSSHYLPFIEMPEDVERAVVSRLKDRLEICQGQELRWFRPAMDYYYN